MFQGPFLSTLPARGATYRMKVKPKIDKFLSTLPARGATGRKGPSIGHSSISIHAPREGSDAFPADGWTHTRIFLSTLPARGATTGVLLVGVWKTYFYPRSPRGERLFVKPSCICSSGFLSTLPARGATWDT